MAMTIRIKRRTTGASGAPTTLYGGELAFNEVDKTLYLGQGADAQGLALTIAPIAGPGAFVTLAGPQTILGDKSFSGTVSLNAATALAPDLSDTSTRLVTARWVKDQGYLTSAPSGPTGTMSSQNANAVAITGGTIDNVVIDGGTY